MNAWQLTGLLVLVGVAAIVLLVAWVTTYFSRIQRQRREERMAVAERAAQNEAASLAFLTLRARAVKLGLAGPIEPALARSSLVNAARSSL
ncbi:MAG: hypothetical protein ABTR54_07670 [Candidatus Competibacter sp.]